MRLYIDKRNNKLVDSDLAKYPISEVSFKRGDSSRIEIIFLDGNTALSATNDKDLKFGIKPTGVYDGEFMVYESNYTCLSTAYIMKPSFNTTALSALLHCDSLSTNDVASVNGMLEITWSENGGTEWFSTNTVTATIYNDVIKGGESGVLQSLTPEQWMLDYSNSMSALTSNFALKDHDNNFSDQTISNLSVNTISLSNSDISIKGNNYFSLNISNNNEPNSNSVIIGHGCGNGAYNANYSVIIGQNAGQSATNASASVFIGNSSGLGSANATSSTFLGNVAGAFATDASNSIFIGDSAGYQATTASDCIIIGYHAGNNITGTKNILIGNHTSLSAVSLSGCLVVGSEAQATQDHTIALGSTASPFLTANSGSTTGHYLVVRLNGQDLKIPLYI